MPRKVWKVSEGSTNTQGWFSNGCPKGAKVSVSVWVSRFEVFSAVVKTVIFWLKAANVVSRNRVVSKFFMAMFKF